MKPIQIRNGVIVYYGNRVGMVQDGQAVVDPMFEREELKDFLNHQRDIREVKWQNGVFDRLVNQAEPSPAGTEKCACLAVKTGCGYPYEVYQL